MKLKRFSALVLCLLMLASLAACKSNGSSSLPHQPTPTNPITLEDATGSPLIGTWNVSATSSNFTQLIFNQNGSLEVHVYNNMLGGVFTDDGTTMTMTISGNTMTGTYTVDGDTITITTADDVLVLTKQ